jgi:hypothetical protein
MDSHQSMSFEQCLSELNSKGKPSERGLSISARGSTLIPEVPTFYPESLPTRTRHGFRHFPATATRQLPVSPLALARIPPYPATFFESENLSLFSLMALNFRCHILESSTARTGQHSFEYLRGRCGPPRARLTKTCSATDSAVSSRPSSMPPVRAATTTVLAARILSGRVLRPPQVG